MGRQWSGEQSRSWKEKKCAAPTLWKSEFMYPFYVNGSESNLLLQLGRGKSESFTKLYSDYKLSLRTQNFSDNFHNCRLLATEEKGKSKIIYRKIFTVVIGGECQGTYNFLLHHRSHFAFFPHPDTFHPWKFPLLLSPPRLIYFFYFS